jgi:hypothetical protein
MSELKGSKRCMLELISSANYISKMNSILEPTGAIIGSADTFMPKGLHDHTEAELKDFLGEHFSRELGTEIRKWWLAKSTPNTRTPNWDLVSTCTINNQKGVLLVEAKAHHNELKYERKGKQLRKDASQNSLANHTKIGLAIEEANAGINKVIRGVSISRDKCYQLSNRIAHAWWLAKHDIPVVIIYLGFLNAEDMNYGGREIFRTDDDWETCFKNHANHVGVDNVMDKWVECGKSQFKLICRSIAV